MRAASRDLFDVIFQEAVVLDVDFFEWDKFLRLVVDAGLVPRNEDEASPIYNVDFLCIDEILWKSNHLRIELDAPNQHCQWTIMEGKLEKEGVFNQISLWGPGPSPELKIKCKGIEISELDVKVIDAINPEWRKPYGPLVRPSLERLHSRRLT